MARPNNSQAAARWRSIAGVFSITLGALLALGLWSGGAAGVVGHWIHLGVRWMFGVPGLLVPVLLVSYGVLQFKRDVEDVAPRLVFGGLATFVSLTGLWHLMAGMPTVSQGGDGLRSAGGVVGATAAFTLADAFSSVGAAFVLLVAVGIGLMALTNTSARQVLTTLNQWRLVALGVADQWRARYQEAKAAKAERDARFSEDEDAQAAIDAFDDQDEFGDHSGVFDEDDQAIDSGIEDDALAPPSFVTDYAADQRYIQPQADIAEDAEVSQTRIVPAPEPPRATVQQDPTLVRPRNIPMSPHARAPRSPDDEVYALSDEALLAQINGEPIGDEVVSPNPLTDYHDPDDDPERAELEADVQDATATKLVPRDATDYQLPPLSMLEIGHAAPDNHESLERMRTALDQMLEQFGVDAQIVAVRRGPTVTRFELELGVGVKVAAITKLDRDIAYALATPDVRIVAPIPGKVAIGIEVPNEDRDFITLGDILMSEVAEQITHPLAAALGLDIGGRPVMVNLAKMPHLLIAGATGSGKSVVMNGIVTSLIMRNTPEQVRMILIDPKQVEMAIYEDVPHLLTRVVTDPKRAKDALDWLVDEMERRYGLLRDYKVRHLDTYNEKASDEDFLPYIVCIIDELADLMMVAKNDVETAIVRIAQKARAVGIHLVIATQRPSVNVVTGLIKANVPSRIALSMATGHDSKTILDQYGAEKLIGQGDMLYMPANVSKPHRLQGSYVDEREIEEIVAFCKAQAPVVYEENVIKEGAEAVMADIKGEDATDEDLTRAAMELVVRSGLGSTSMLQRKLQVGFARAGRIMDELERMGVVGPSEGPKARVVLMTVDELEDLVY
ncbi:DNA translocase FtsK [Stomatohabitans albus]|uniref:FtsK/SpoIIIE family DNA translocase n=1 Tax=Stomatohabitans albus TaxID=3110766 RepID=UPI00300CACAB